MAPPCRGEEESARGGASLLLPCRGRAGVGVARQESVIPAQAGIQKPLKLKQISAFADNDNREGVAIRPPPGGLRGV